jgi:hypothetical protein
MKFTKIGIATVAISVMGSQVALAQEPACRLYKVNTSLLSVSKDLGSRIHNYIDVLGDGEIACVARRQTVDGSDWGYVPYKLEKPNKQTPVDGWSVLRYMAALSPAEAAAPPVAAAAPSAPVAAAAAAPAAAIRPEDILHFDHPIPFGPFPVNGHSIKELIESTPLFAPIEDLPDEVWKEKKCTTCHKWTAERLCDQGKTYVKSPRYALRIQHPFGGPLKVALMGWVKSGCQ